MYTSIDDVKLLLQGTAGGLPAAADSLSDEQIQAEINRSEAEIDMLLGSIYEVPFDPVPNIIQYLARDIAVYFSDLLFRMSNGYGTSLDPILLRYKSARMLLDGLAARVYDLGTASTRFLDPEVLNPYDGILITERHLFGPAIFG